MSYFLAHATAADRLASAGPGLQAGPRLTVSLPGPLRSPEQPPPRAIPPAAADSATPCHGSFTSTCERPWGSLDQRHPDGDEAVGRGFRAQATPATALLRALPTVNPRASLRITLLRIATQTALVPLFWRIEGDRGTYRPTHVPHPGSTMPVVLRNRRPRIPQRPPTAQPHHPPRDRTLGRKLRGATRNRPTASTGTTQRCKAVGGETRCARGCPTTHHSHSKR
jgi:hypothetical protein